MRVLILLLLFIISCQQDDGRQSFESRLLENTPFTLSLDGVYPNINKDHEIKSPPNTWVRIFQSTILNEDGARENHCVFYRVPGKEPGVLRYIQSVEPCLENYGSSNTTDWELISTLKVWKPEFERKIFKKVLKPGHFYFTGKGNKGEFFVEVPLYNLKLKRKLERHSSIATNNMLESVFISKRQNPKSKKSHSKLLGEFEDNYRDKTSIVCQEFSKDCKETTSFNCEQCKFGWYSAVGISTCGGQFTRFCGVNRCGQRGMPACPRGINSAKKMGLDNVMLCYDGSPMGYCEVGLKTVCDGKILVCL